MSDTIPYIKKDAIVSVSLGTGHIQRLQHVLSFLLEGHSQEEINAISSHVEKGTLSPWESSVSALVQTLNLIMKSAQAAGQLEQRPITDLLG